MARLMLRLSLGDRELNRFLNRITMVPSGILSDLRGRGDDRTPTQIFQGFTNMVNPTLGLSDDDTGQIGRVPEDLSTEETARMVELIGNLLMMTTGVPPSVFRAQGYPRTHQGYRQGQSPGPRQGAG